MCNNSNNELIKSRIDNLNIFPSESDKTTNDILSITSPFNILIPNFINFELNERISTLSSIDGRNFFKSGSEFKEFKKAFFDEKQGTIFIPDLDELSTETKKLLENGQYKIGDSLKVDGNKRAVIVDTLNHNQRVEDITLKEVQLKNTNSSDKLLEQVKLQEIYNLILEIQSEQQFQIEWDRNNSILPPIFSARTKLIDAQDTHLDINEKTALIKEANNYLEEAFNKLRADLITNRNHVVKTLNNPTYKYQKLEEHSNFILKDLQTMTHITGFQLLIDYSLCNTKKFERTLKNYEESIHLVTEENISLPNSLTEKIKNYFSKNKLNIIDNKISLLELIHNNYRYKNVKKDFWLDFLSNINNFEQIMIENNKLEVEQNND
ncbi:hypothetical protein ADO06_01256 [Streptococcus parauberis]|nr:hypothetical protein ADO06_01256 [Streptococcus parauberis]